MSELTLSFNGLLGLAPRSQNPTQASFIDHLKENGLLKQKLFSIYLAKQSGESQLTFGGYDTEILEQIMF